MPGPLNADLSDALAIRLQLQISLSILPVVEEWMDTDMNRWLESVPMPPEMAGQGRPSFLVTVASDRSRVRWSAHGHPAGFVPKMAEYLSKCGVSAKEVDVINHVGDELRPEKVGTWVEVETGDVMTGWHFLDERPVALLAGLLHSGRAGLSFLEWAAAIGITVFHRYSRAIGDRAFLDVGFDLRGPDLADRLDTAASAFTAFGVGALPDYARAAAEASGSGDLALVVRLDEDRIDRVGLVIGRMAGDAVVALCRQAGVELDPELERLKGALSADGAASAEFSLASGEPAVDLHLVPGSAGGAEPTPPPARN